MKNYKLTHLSDDALLRELGTIVARDRATTALLLAHIAEVDTRRLYVAAGYSSMHAYCVGELHLSDDAAYRRITAARAARRHPVLFEAVEDGRLHLAAVSLLAPRLTEENLQGLIDGATHRRKSEVEDLLARRFPTTNVPVRTCVIRPLGPAVPRTECASSPVLPLEQALSEREVAEGRVETAVLPSDVDELVPGRVEGCESDPAVSASAMDDLAPKQAASESLVPGRVHSAAEEQSPQPERYLLRLTIEKGTLEKLRYLQALLSHSIPSGNLEKVLDRALEMAIPQLEKRKFGAATVPPEGARAPRKATRPARKTRSARNPRTSARSRRIPAHVRRAVWERDQRRCTFVSASGKRCHETRFLEFDHIDPFARGGSSTVDGLRLRCRAHNQHEAERVFGPGFMAQKRREARLARAKVASGQAGGTTAVRPG